MLNINYKKSKILYHMVVYDYQTGNYRYQIEILVLNCSKKKPGKYFRADSAIDIFLFSRAPGLHRITHTMADRGYLTPS
jgi:hypothetical protein